MDEGFPRCVFVLGTMVVPVLTTWHQEVRGAYPMSRKYGPEERLRNGLGPKVGGQC